MSTDPLRRRPRFAPVLEQLETRLVPAGTFRIRDIDGNRTPDVVITGDQNRQTVRIIDDPSANRTTISFDNNGDSDFADSNEFRDRLFITTFEKFNITLGDNNDTLTYEVKTNSGYDAPLGSRRTLTADTRGGNDSVTLTFPDGVVFQRGALINFNLTLGTGNDTLTTTIASDFELGTLNLTAALGTGDDRFTATMMTGGFDLNSNLSALNLTVNGDLGNDSLTVTRADNGAQAIITGLLSLTLNGGAGEDVTTVDLGGPLVGADDLNLEMTGIVRVRADAGDGNDQIFLNLRNSPTSKGVYDLALLGNTGDDELFFSIFDYSAGGVTYAPANALIDGGAGTDFCYLTVGQSGGLNALPNVLNCEA